MCRKPSFVAAPFILDEVTMHQHVTPQELVESFTIMPSERERLGTKSGASRLGCAVLLKYFQCAGRFPASWHDVPREVIRHLARSVGVSPEAYRHYDLDERLARYHKERIRQGTGFRQGNTTDAEAITAWGGAHSRVDETTIPVLIDRLTARYKQLQIELPTPGRLERLAHSAAHTVEEPFFARLTAALAPDTRHMIDAMLTDMSTPGSLSALKIDTGRRSLNSLEGDVEKLHQLQRLTLPQDLLVPLSTRYLRRMKLRVTAESLSATRRHPDPIRYGLVTLFCYARTQEITDRLVELLLHIVRKMGVNAEKRVDEELLADFKRVTGKTGILFQMAEASLDHPKGQVDEVIYPVVGEQTLRDLVKEYRATGRSYREKVHTVMRGSYSHHYRRMVPQLLSVLAFHSNNEQHQPVMQALDLVQKYTTSKRQFYGEEEEVPLDGVVPKEWQDAVLEPDAKGQPRVNRINYEMHTLHALRERVRCKEIWVPGAQRYRNPEDALPADFADQRTLYYQALNKPLEPGTVITGLQRQMQQALQRLDTGMPHNPGVKILQRPQGWIRVAKMARQPDPPPLAGLKAEITRRWPLTGLLDVLKETDLRVGFTQHFTGTGIRSALDDETLQRRLLLCLFGLGRNAGLKRVCATPPGEQYHDLLYGRRRYLHPDALRNAIAEVVNAIFRIRAAHIWGEGTTACASDAKQFGAWDQNLLTEWHMRYGGRGVMIYWHVEKHATCIYSQLKTCSSSAVAFMLEGLLRHGTEMEVEKNYVDSGGQSEVGFAFCHLLGFHLLPRLKGIHRQKLYRPLAGHPDAYPHLQTILERPIRWDLIRQQYDQMIKYATALRLGTADADTILKRFTRSQFQHPTYRALTELGKAIKPVFLCQYLHEDALRREINDGLQVVENWNSANDFIFFGKGGEIATNRFEDQELAMLSLHLLQISFVYINTLMIQQVLADQAWLDRMTPDDWRALTPLIYAHINPYGTFELDMQKRLHLEAA
jgi:TnpA family transposase/flagellar biosynthesis chaperone FliJ